MLSGGDDVASDSSNPIFTTHSSAIYTGIGVGLSNLRCASAHPGANEAGLEGIPLFDLMGGLVCPFWNQVALPASVVFGFAITVSKPFMGFAVGSYRILRVL